MPQFGPGGSGNTGVPRSFKGLPIVRGMDDGTPVFPAPPATYDDTVVEAGAADDSATSATATVTDTVTDTGSASDTSVGTLVTSGAASDTLAGADSQTGGLLASAASSDTLSASESETGVVTFAGSTADTLSGSDSSTGLTTVAGAVSDTLSGADTQAAVAVMGDSVTDTGGASDSVTAAVDSIAAVSEAVGASDSSDATTSSATVYDVSAAESLSVTDSTDSLAALQSIGGGRPGFIPHHVGDSLVDLLTVTDAVAVTVVRAPIVDERVSLADLARCETITAAAIADRLRARETTDALVVRAIPPLRLKAATRDVLMLVESSTASVVRALQNGSQDDTPRDTTDDIVMIAALYYGMFE